MTGNDGALEREQRERVVGEGVDGGGEGSGGCASHSQQRYQHYHFNQQSTTCVAMARQLTLFRQHLQGHNHEVVSGGKGGLGAEKNIFWGAKLVRGGGGGWV